METSGSSQLCCYLLGPAFTSQEWSVGCIYTSCRTIAAVREQNLVPTVSLQFRLRGVKGLHLNPKCCFPDKPHSRWSFLYIVNKVFVWWNVLMDEPTSTHKMWFLAGWHCRAFSRSCSHFGVLLGSFVTNKPSCSKATLGFPFFHLGALPALW